MSFIIHSYNMLFTFANTSSSIINYHSPYSLQNKEVINNMIVMS